MHDSGYVWPVIDIRIRYAKPVVLGQIITVNTDIVEGKNYLKINYLITDKLTSLRLTKGYSIQVVIDSQTKEMCFESPSVLLEKLGFI